MSFCIAFNFPSIHVAALKVLSSGSGALRVGHGENFAIASGAVGSGVGDTRWGSHKLGLAEAQTGLGRGVVAMVGSG